MANLYSIGHSVHPIEAFLRLLTLHRVEALVDVRSQPASMRNPQFNRGSLARSLHEIDIDYVFKGVELGGRPREAEFYDAEGFVLYDRIATSERFRLGLDDVAKLSMDRRVALMCSEENPSDCHRSLLIGRVLNENGVALGHIRGDGRIEEELKARKPLQGSLFGGGDQDWKSIRSVLPRNQPNNSSHH